MYRLCLLTKRFYLERKKRSVRRAGQRREAQAFPRPRRPRPPRACEATWYEPLCWLVRCQNPGTALSIALTDTKLHAIRPMTTENQWVSMLACKRGKIYRSRRPWFKPRSAASADVLEDARLLWSRNALQFLGNRLEVLV